jgi:hypothetical protein
MYRYSLAETLQHGSLLFLLQQQQRQRQPLVVVVLATMPDHRATCTPWQMVLRHLCASQQLQQDQGVDMHWRQQR